MEIAKWAKAFAESARLMRESDRKAVEGGLDRSYAERAARRRRRAVWKWPLLVAGTWLLAVLVWLGLVAAVAWVWAAVVG